MLFAETIKEQRDARSWSQEYLARNLGVSETTVANWEKGKQLPNIHQLILVSDLFQISLDELIKSDPGVQRRLSSKNDWFPQSGWEFFSRYWWLTFAFLGWLSWLVIVLISK